MPHPNQDSSPVQDDGSESGSLQPSWLEVSLVVDGELAEAVAEVLGRFAPDGVVIESTGVTAQADDSEGHAVGPLRVAAYLPVDSALDAQRSKLEESLWYLGRIRPLPPAQFQFIAETDWSESWKQHYKPIPVGERLLVLPAWIDMDPGNRLAVRIDPGMAFGTGTHPTTRLCLELAESCFAQAPVPQTVIDVGCGSGILAVAALLLGAERALAVDIDAEAIHAAHSNAETNGVSERLELAQGSVGEVRSGQFSLQQAPLVLANILAVVLVRMFAEGLGELVSTGGSLVLSGILEEQLSDVLSAAQEHGFIEVERLTEGDWVAVRLQTG